MKEQRKKKTRKAKQKKKKKKKIKRVREFTRHNMSYVSFCCDKGEVMLIIVVWLACCSYGINQ